MSTQQAKLGEQIDVAPLGNALLETKTQTLLSTEKLKVVRLVLPAGKQIAEHKAPGEITVHCLEGEIVFTTMGESMTLAVGQLLHVEAAEPHALKARADSNVLVTIDLP